MLQSWRWLRVIEDIRKPWKSKLLCSPALSGWEPDLVISPIIIIIIMIMIIMVMIIMIIWQKLFEFWETSINRSPSSPSHRLTQWPQQSGAKEVQSWMHHAGVFFVCFTSIKFWGLQYWHHDCSSERQEMDRTVLEIVNPSQVGFSF